MKKIITIDHDRCTACGLCVKVCTKQVLHQEKPGDVPSQVEEAICAACGHCVAVCPTNALTNERVKAENCKPLGEQTISPETMAEFLASKRSVRRFTSQELDRQTIETLIATARMAPTAKNRQDRGFIVVTDRQKIQAMDRAVCQSFAKLLKILSKPLRSVLKLSLPALIGELEKNIPSLQQLVKRSEAGEMPIFHNAPCVVMITGRKGNMLAKDDAVIAQQYLMLQAQAAGLASCIIGYASTRTKALTPFVKIPDGHAIQTVTILGHPETKYLKTVDRRPAKIIWE